MLFFLNGHPRASLPVRPFSGRRRTSRRPRRNFHVHARACVSMKSTLSQRERGREGGGESEREREREIHGVPWSVARADGAHCARTRVPHVRAASDAAACKSRVRNEI